jgi:2,4-dienoyl-CoA reductase-like NADH-dependent reductase (Old Yellow Enzyme family)
MGMYSATSTGHATDFHLMHVGHLAFRGAALTIMEVSAVHPTGRSSPIDLGVWSDEHIAHLKKVTDFVHEQEGERKVGIQLGHAGRKAGMLPIYPGKKTRIATREEGGWAEEVVGASKVRFSENHVEPREMTEEDIAGVVRAFGDAACRAVKAGFGK